MVKRTLLDKWNDPMYLEELSERRRRELEFAKQILNAEELQSYSSIDIAYREARRKFIENYMPFEQQEEYLNNKKPIFSVTFKKVLSNNKR